MLIASAVRPFMKSTPRGRFQRNSAVRAQCGELPLSAHSGHRVRRSECL
jgi:hypothetical protein